MPSKPECRKCHEEIMRAGGGWTHKDKSKTYDHAPRPPRGQDRPSKD